MWGDKVETYLNNYKGYKIAFTGHSLGGAIASLTALKARHLGLVDVDKLTLYTFGEPRIGDSDVAKNFRDLVKESYRVVHYSDLVPHLPLCDGFFSDSCTEKAGWPHHQPQEIWYYNTDLTMDNSKFKICDANGGEDPNCSDGISVLEFAKNIGTDRGADMHLHYYDHKLDEYGPKGCNSAVKFGLSFIALIFLFIFNLIKH
uniref:Fungal lipase-like domain-containing protein n=1 Tax=Panagrolaimus davidi TaxID=227884 RepID=A0A914Q9C9_9BILA